MSSRAPPPVSVLGQTPFEKNVPPLPKDGLTTPSLVLCYADWCGACQRTKPVFAAVETSLDRFGVDLNDQKNAQFGRDYDVQSIPTILYFVKQGRAPKKLIGASDRERLQSFLSTVQA